MLAELAHEVSRPLSAALNYAELALQDPGLSAAVRARLEKVAEEVERAGEVLRRFVQLGRPARPYADRVDLNEAVHAAAAAARPTIEQALAGLALDLDPHLPCASGDPQQLEALVRNLIENAVEAAAKTASEPQASIRTETIPGAVRLTVIDNGPGVPEGMEERIFEPFYSTKGRGRETGLGLAIARRIAEEHGGRIWVERGPGGGAAMVVEMPEAPETSSPRDSATGPLATRAPHEPPEPSPLAPLPGGEGKRQGDGERRRALVVDDDASMRSLLAVCLEGLGYETDQAPDGREALARSLAEEYDLIICDVKMPTLDGTEYYQALRAEAPERAARVVFATGVLATDETDAFLRSLPNPRLRKPFRLAALRRVIAGDNGQA